MKNKESKINIIYNKYIYGFFFSPFVIDHFVYFPLSGFSFLFIM